MKQLSLIPKPNTEHGGSLDAGKRKELRPLDSKKLAHLVLKSSGTTSLFRHREFVMKTIRRQAELAGVKLYDISIQHNHIHHSVAFSHRNCHHKFVRAVTSLLSRRFGRGMWKYRPYTRVVSWGRDFKNLKAYIKQNELEAWGQIPYQPRKKT